MKLVSLTCPSCGATLDVGPSIDNFACGFCASNIVVERSGNIVVLRLLNQAIGKVQRGTDRTAAELAIRRLSEEVKQLEREEQACDRALAQITAKWSGIGKIGFSGRILGAGIVFFICYVVTFSLLDGKSDLVKFTVGLFVGGIPAGFVWRLIRRQQTQLIAEQIELRDQEIDIAKSAKKVVGIKLAASMETLRVQHEIVRTP